jgi:hypothetical protein
MTVADRMSQSAGEQKSGRLHQIVLISDMQHGAETAALQAYQWPTEVSLQIESVAAKSPNNAGVRLLADEQAHGWRVRVSNATGATVEQFRVAWGIENPLQKPDPQQEMAVYVPAGQSRVVKMNDPPARANHIRVSGDEYAFDNEFFFAPIVKQELRVGYVGDDKSDDPQGLRYFLERVWSESPRRKVAIEDQPPETIEKHSAKKVPLIVVSSAPSPASVEVLQSYVRDGGTVLLIVSEPAVAASLVNFAPGVKRIDDTKQSSGPDSYSLFGEIKFDHPIFASFAGPRYNDFTKVRIWKHQRFAIDSAAQADVLARFDNGDPAIWEQPFGSGRVLWLACGWRPADSQLALSSKFVPLLSSLLDHAAKSESATIHAQRVHQPVTVPVRSESASMSMTKPDGNVTPLAAQTTSFGDTDQPGIYRFQQGETALAFAVNLSPNESDTSPMAADHLQQLGVRVGREQSASEKLERQRQMRDIELESRQKLWKWLLVGVLGVLLVETTLASRLAKSVTKTNA